MAAKPDNTKPNVVLAPSQTMANMITPSPVSLPPRRSSRLFGSTQSVKENSKGPGKGRIKSKSRLLQSNRQLSENELNEKNRLSDGKAERERLGGVLEPDHKPAKPQAGGGVNLGAEAEKLQRASVRGLLQLLRQLGGAFLRLARYDCREGARLLALLPAAHGSSAWVRATLGKCHFEMNEYKEACGYFSLVRAQDPYRLELMEYYSTARWHLQEAVQLSALAQDLQRIDKFSAAAWCAAGNCFSHQKEHENAIKFFQRAVQVDCRGQLGDSSPSRSAPTSPTPSPCWDTSTCWWRSWRRPSPASGR
jgi:anaphase-promoting complex subunit 3